MPTCGMMGKRDYAAGVILCLSALALVHACPYIENATCVCLNLNTRYGSNVCFNTTEDVPSPLEVGYHGFDCCQILDSPPSHPSQGHIVYPPHGGWNEMQFLRGWVQGASGVPFMVSDAFPHRALLKAVSTAERMLAPPNHKTNLTLAHNILDSSGRIMLRAWSERVCTDWKDINTCDDRKMPGMTPGASLGGPVPSAPTGGSGQEEICYTESNGERFPHWRGTYGFFEEFFHTMHALGIENSYPNLYDEIVRVGNASVAAGEYRYCLIDPDPDCQSCLDDWNHCIIFEWFASVAKVWYGLLQECNIGPNNLCEYQFRSRAQIKKYSPESARLMLLIFPDDDWNPCEVGFHIPAMCAWEPGCAWCGSTLSKNYTGPPIDPLSQEKVTWLTERAQTPASRTLEDVYADMRRRATRSRLKRVYGH